MEEKKKAVIYCRVSTKEQVEEGNSLKTQEKICKEYALKHGYEISQVFIELGESAKTADRTELKKLLAFCTSKKEKINAVIVYRIDRLSRQMEDYTVIKSKLKQSGVEIKSTAEYFEDNPAGRFMENIIANVAQFDNDVRTERSTNGMKEAIREGRYVWKAPYGYNNGTINGKSNIVPNEFASIVKEAFQLIAENIVPVERVRLCLVKKYESNPGIIIPSRTRFPELLRKEIYTGWINAFDERHKGVFEPLISEGLFAKVQNVIDGRKVYKLEYKIENPDFPLRRFFFHPTGLKLTGAWSRGKSKKYPYYFFRTPNSIFKKDNLEALFLQTLDEFSFSPKYFAWLAKKIHEKLTMKEEDTNRKRLLYAHEIERYKEKQHALIQKNLVGTLSDAILKQELDILEKQIANTEKLIPDSLTSQNNLDAAISFIREFVEHPAKTWKKADIKGKMRLQWFYFPRGVEYDGTNCRTPKICKLFQLKMLFDTNFVGKVNHPGTKCEHSTWSQSPPYEESENVLRDIFWDNIKEEVVQLSEIKKTMT
jgi:site-specific DNA recombinase